jgi:hypothetical protein
MKPSICSVACALFLLQQFAADSRLCCLELGKTGVTIQFNLRLLFVWISFAAAGCLAIRYPTRLTVALVSMITAMLIAGAAVAAVFGSDKKKVFWTTFAAFGLSLQMADVAYQMGFVFPSLVGREDDILLHGILGKLVVVVLATVAAFVARAIYSR